SRIVLFDQMLRINKNVMLPAGGRVVLNIHDEIISAGPSYGALYLGKKLNEKGKLVDVWQGTDGADAMFAKVTEEMCLAPAWCLDLPLDSEGGFAFEYSK